MRVPSIAALLFAALACEAGATDVTVVGLFSNKVVVTINRGAPRTLSVGQTTPEGVRVLGVSAKGAELEVDGKRQVLEMGQHFETPSQAEGARASVTLAPDSRGHFIADAQVNGGHMRFLVDTGATMVRISRQDAQRLGIDYTKGEQGYSIVADGRRVQSWRIKLDSVSVGSIVLYNVDATVGEGSVGFGLLGMSFLSRTEMRREGPNLTLTKLY